MKTVLIVDDEKGLIKSIEAGLKVYRDKFEVISALDGVQALKILQSENIDLVVTDLKMPKMDGFELLTHICTEFAFIPTIVMTAFSTPDIEAHLKSTNSLKLLEKPIDFDELANAILENLDSVSKEYTVAGFSLSNFMQLLQMEQKTSLINVKSGKSHGYIYFKKGELCSAVTENAQGEEAVYQMLSMKNIEISIKKLPLKKIKKNIKNSLMSVLLEGAKREDDKPLPAPDAQEQKEEDKAGIQESKQKIHNPNNIIKGVEEMGKIEESLERLKDVEGFMAAGVFTPNGEMASQVNVSGLKIEEIGALANDVLLKAQKATDLMDVGRGKIVHVEAPNAHIIARCHNESTDFAANEAGKAHIHVVMILESDGNLAMGKMKLESVMGDVAVAFR